MTLHSNTWLRRLGWVALAAPGLGQLILLLWAVGGRFGHPYDLEWMEGGLLHHAQRIGDGSGVYVPPSLDFIPYLYTPLYPGLVAVLGSIGGISYQVGRAISVAAMIAILVVVARAIVGRRRGRDRGPATAGAILAMGFYAAGYPYVEGWYDLVRGDTLALAMVTAGLHGCARWSRIGTGWRGHARIAAAAALLALAFFAKQTAILYVVGGGAIVLILAWRRTAAYVVTAGVIGLGGSWLLQRTTGGWFWTYAYEIHQRHDFNMDRFWDSFGHVLWHFPALSLVIAGALIVVAVTVIRHRALPPAARPLLVWAPIYGLSTVVGAVGYGTQFAHFNAYMPALLHGAIAAGAAVPAIVACARLLAGGPGEPDVSRPLPIGPSALLSAGVPDRAPRRAATIGASAGAAVVVILGVQLILAWWRPSRFIPTAADRAAGDALIARLRAIDGEIWLPSHPWYAHLAGKPVRTHRMGINDVTTIRPQRPGEPPPTAKPYVVDGLARAIAEHRFAAIILDGGEASKIAGLTAHYRRGDLLRGDERPRTFTGFPTVPEAVYVPIGPEPLPPGARVLFDFEKAGWQGWTITGDAWGNGPVSKEVADQGPVARWGGRRFATSMHGGDKEIGTLTSPPFTIDGVRITLRLSGGAAQTALRAELVIDGTVVRSGQPPEPSSERFVDTTWDVVDLAGKEARLVFTDDARGSWGHLNVDEVWIWNDPPAPAAAAAAAAPASP